MSRHVIPPFDRSPGVASFTARDGRVLAAFAAAACLGIMVMVLAGIAAAGARTAAVNLAALGIETGALAALALAVGRFIAFSLRQEPAARGLVPDGTHGVPMRYAVRSPQMEYDNA